MPEQEIRDTGELPYVWSLQTPEPEHEGDFEYLGEKISKNREQIEKFNEKIRKTNDRLEEITIKKQKETLRDKAKKIALLGPKICVEANVCRIPKAICERCRKLAPVLKSVRDSGFKIFSRLANTCGKTLFPGRRFPVVRRKMNKNFKVILGRTNGRHVEIELFNNKSEK